MILYLSSVLEDNYFAELVRNQYIISGHQAQKFNSLVVRGLKKHTDVVAISNPQFNSEFSFEVQTEQIGADGVHYFCVKNHHARFKKVLNLYEIRKYIKQNSKINRIDAVICDAINPQASLNALLYARKKKIPAVAIVTDIPAYMDAGKRNFFTVLTEFLMKRYDAYVLLTEAMNDLVNPKKKPHIVMEGLCELSRVEDEEVTKKSGNVFTCVYTGSLSKATGLENLVNAMKLIDDPKVRLEIYGNGPLSEWIRGEAEKDNRIFYGGVVTNDVAVKAQKNASLLINPRPSDISYGNVSFPSKVMEYMASGTPLLTTKLPGIPVEYYDYVYIVDENSERDIAKAIQYVHEIPKEHRDRLGARAQRFVCENKNYEVQANRILGLISAVRKNEQ